METWKDIVGDRLASMNGISSKVTDKTFDKLVEEVYYVLMSADYDEDKGFKDLEIFETIEEVIADCISGYFDSEIAYINREHLSEKTYGTLRGYMLQVSRVNKTNLKLDIYINKKICYNLYKFIIIL